MNTVGIMTFFESNSLGANLQAFALQMAIEKLGLKCEIINYDRKGDNPKSAQQNNAKDCIIRIVSGVNAALNKNNRQLTEKRFEEFRTNYLNIAQRRYNNLEELMKDPPVYDFYVTGSDQVWNPYTGNRTAYFLPFVNDGHKKIAYAPSIGVKKIGDKYEKLFTDYLKDFNSLSCREQVGAKEISRIINRAVDTVLDPTLLISPEEWNEFSAEVKIPDKPYMLCYFLGSLKSSRELAKKIAREKKLEILDIPGSPADTLWNVKKAKGIGPREFLFLVKNADYICTDSFHGTAFSINYEKPFLCFQRRGYNNEMSFGSRLENILQITGLENCLVIENSNEYDSEYAEENIVKSQRKLFEMKCFSTEFIKNSFKNCNVHNVSLQ